MPIKVTCNHCSVTLRAADTAAGKKIKCPKCSAVLQVPSAVASKAVEKTRPANDEPTESMSSTRKGKEEERPARSEDDERPRRRRRAARRSESNNRLWLGLGIGGLVLVILGVVLFLLFGLSGPAEVASDSGKKNKPHKEPEKAKGNEPEVPQPDPVRKEENSRNSARGHEKTLMLKRIEQLGLAFHAYHSELNHFPMSTVEGRGQLSWRVAILPFIEQQGLYRQFKLQEPWDSEHNLNVLNKSAMPSIFDSPRSNAGGERKTFLQLFTGPGTCYPTPNAKLKIPSISSGVTNTWLAAEAETPVEWTRPVDLEVKDGKVPPLGGAFDGDFFVLCADGKPHYVFKSQFSLADTLSLINPASTARVTGWPPE